MIYDIISAYRVSYQNMNKRKERLKKALELNETDLRCRQSIDFQIERLNIIQADLGFIIGDQRLRRFVVKNFRRSALK